MTRHVLGLLVDVAKSATEGAGIEAVRVYERGAERRASLRAERACQRQGALENKLALVDARSGPFRRARRRVIENRLARISARCGDVSRELDRRAADVVRGLQQLGMPEARVRKLNEARRVMARARNERGLHAEGIPGVRLLAGEKAEREFVLAMASLRRMVASKRIDPVRAFAAVSLASEAASEALEQWSGRYG